jgi:hypothetical protein
LALNFDQVFSRGGKNLVSMLQYAVRSANVDLLFIYLAGEFRQAPTAAKALALYRVFCGPRAPARLSVPTHSQLASAIRPFEVAAATGQGVAVGVGVPAARAPVPRYLFDLLVAELKKNSKHLRAARRNYRMRKSPAENLPFAQLTEWQRHFAEYVWKPIVRPALVEAGFWRVSSIG